MSTENQLKSVMRDVFTALEKGDWATIESHPGLHETRQHFPYMLNAIPDLQNTVDHTWTCGNMIATVGTCHGTHQGEWMGIAATGKPVSFMVLGIDIVEDGKVVQHWALPDFMSLIHQIGATIQPTAS
jgi:predicted ester cyclase